MLTDTIKLRLSSLRQPQVPQGESRRTGERASRSSSSLADCFPGGAVCQMPQGEVFACEIPLREMHSDASQLMDAYLEAFQVAGTDGGDPAHLHLSQLRSAAPEATALIDTETAGFHGRPLFLVGLLRCQADDLALTQYFARDYAQEAALLAKLADLLPEIGLLVSFNGKAFDWPFIRERMVYHRLKCQAAFAHLDLLHASRRRWRDQLPNCQLKTLERHLCGRWRNGDIPSHEIPQRYYQFVREQDARLIAPVFHHNRLDLITMLQLLIALASRARRPVHQTG